MTLENFQLICNLVMAVLGIIPTVISLIVLIKNIIANKNWSLVTTMVQNAMSTVETYALTHPGMTGDDKLNMAVDAVRAACASADIKVDEVLIKKIVAYISELCSWSKTVNTK